MSSGTLKLAKYSIGVGDRFARQGAAQLRACVRCAERGVTVVPVWNKSNREHLIVGSDPAGTRAAADAAVRTMGWRQPYHLDADHIRLETVERFLPHCDFFTIDVADWIGQPAAASAGGEFAAKHPELTGKLNLQGLEGAVEISPTQLAEIARKYLTAVREAGRIYRHITDAKGAGSFITEVSMDETDAPQTPAELAVILAALADEAVPLQTIAPKFSGRFNKGVDYVGDASQFDKEFDADLAVVAFATRTYALPDTLKLSIHSGSDKFRLYGPMRRAMDRRGAGVHLKTAGTTWLEELIGLAESGGEGLKLAKEIYARALGRLDELCAPYAAVIDIQPTRLPSAATVAAWSSEQYVSTLRHEPGRREFNADFRQLLHVGYKVAAEMGDRYLDALESCREVVGRNVTTNLYERHLKPLFV